MCVGGQGHVKTAIRRRAHRRPRTFSYSSQVPAVERSQFSGPDADIKMINAQDNQRWS